MHIARNPPDMGGYIDSNGFECSVEFEMIAHGKGHVALGARKGWTTAHPLAVVCWLCGKSHEECMCEPIWQCTCKN